MYCVLCILEGRKDARKNKSERSPHYEKTSQSPYQRQKVAPGEHVRFCPKIYNAERRWSPVTVENEAGGNKGMILFQVRDLAAKACGEPHIAPTWEIAKASLGAMLAKTPELAERAHSIVIEKVSSFDPEWGCRSFCYGKDRLEVTGDVCLAEFRAACTKEEEDHQVEADGYATSTVDFSGVDGFKA